MTRSTKTILFSVLGVATLIAAALGLPVFLSAISPFREWLFDRVSPEFIFYAVMSVLVGVAWLWGKHPSMNVQTVLLLVVLFCMLSLGFLMPGYRKGVYQHQEYRP